MEPFYLEIRAVHIAAVMLSGLLMFTRGLVRNLAGPGWAMAWPARSLSYAIDTVLLTAALMLTTIVQQYPFADGWLTAKVALLLVYIMLGYAALRGRSAWLRWASLGGAALIYAFIVSVARAHDPLGLFA
jgi:uncharacterized membrane protein SirB2